MVLLKDSNESTCLILSNLEKSAYLWRHNSKIKVIIRLKLKRFAVFDSELYASAKNALVVKKYNNEIAKYVK